MEWTLIDSHTHIYLEQFDEDRDQVISDSKNSNIEALYMPNIDSDTVDRLKQTADRYPGYCIPMMGLHPCSVDADYQTELRKMENELAHGIYQAVGEIGIDLYWDRTHVDEQTDAFTQQVKWATELQLPIVIHCRESMNLILDLLESLATLPETGIFHCFTGSRQQADRVIRLGFLLGIGGVLTFKNSGLRDVVTDIPLKHLVLETDSPYLAPAPFRGKRNQPPYLRYVAECLAEVKDMGITEIAKQTTRNTRRIFNQTPDRRPNESS